MQKNNQISLPERATLNNSTLKSGGICNVTVFGIKFVNKLKISQHNKKE